MATINTRLVLQSKNLFSNSLNQRIDKSFPVTAEVLKRVKSITSTSSGSATTLLAVSDYGVDKDVLVFIRNRATAKAKYLYIIIGSQQIIRLAPGQYSILPWRTESGDDFKIYGNDSNGINVEYLVGTMA